jgi:hypothetical protein
MYPILKLINLYFYPTTNISPYIFTHVPPPPPPQGCSSTWKCNLGNNMFYINKLDVFSANWWFVEIVRSYPLVMHLFFIWWWEWTRGSKSTLVDDVTIVIYFLLFTLIIFTCFLPLFVNVLSLVVGTRWGRHVINIHHVCNSITHV